MDSLKHEINSERTFVKLVQNDSEIIGYLIMNPKNESALKHTAFFSMGVDPDHHGKGVGSLLVESMLSERSSNIEIIYLMVRADNLGAIKLYEKFEFQKITVLENDTKIDSKYYDGVLMSKSFL